MIMIQAKARALRSSHDGGDIMAGTHVTARQARLNASSQSSGASITFTVFSPRQASTSKSRPHPLFIY